MFYLALVAYITLLLIFHPDIVMCIYIRVYLLVRLQWADMECLTLNEMDEGKSHTRMQFSIHF